MSKPLEAAQSNKQKYCDSYECEDDIRTLQRAAMLIGDAEKWPVLEKKLADMQAGVSKFVKLGLHK